MIESTIFANLGLFFEQTNKFKASKNNSDFSFSFWFRDFVFLDQSFGYLQTVISVRIRQKVFP